MNETKVRIEVGPTGAKHIFGLPLTPEQRARQANVLAEVEAEFGDRPSIATLIERGYFSDTSTPGGALLNSLVELGRQLRAAREGRQKSLENVAAASQIDEDLIRRAENGTLQDPTLEFLQRCALASGKRIELRLVEPILPPPVPPRPSGFLLTEEQRAMIKAAEEELAAQTKCNQRQPVPA